MTSCETEFECDFKIILSPLCSAVVCKAQREEKNFARREIQSKLGEIYCRLGSLSLLAGGRYYTRAKEGTTPGLKKEEGKKGLLTDMVKQIVAEEWYSGWLTDRNILDISC